MQVLFHACSCRNGGKGKTHNHCNWKVLGSCQCYQQKGNRYLKINLFFFLLPYCYSLFNVRMRKPDYLAMLTHKGKHSLNANERTAHSTHSCLLRQASHSNWAARLKSSTRSPVPPLSFLSFPNTTSPLPDCPPASPLPREQYPRHPMHLSIASPLSLFSPRSLKALLTDVSIARCPFFHFHPKLSASGLATTLC